MIVERVTLRRLGKALAAFCPLLLKAQTRDVEGQGSFLQRLLVQLGLAGKLSSHYMYAMAHKRSLLPFLRSPVPFGILS